MLPPEVSSVQSPSASAEYGNASLAGSRFIGFSEYAKRENACGLKLLLWAATAIVYFVFAGISTRTSV